MDELMTSAEFDILVAVERSMVTDAEPFRTGRRYRKGIVSRCVGCGWLKTVNGIDYELTDGGAAALEKARNHLGANGYPKRTEDQKLSSLRRRFWEKVQQSSGDGCWIWTGSRNGDGYGLIAVGSRTDGSLSAMRAHRVAFFIEHGRWPEPNALHACDNPPCVRVHPKHVFEGTPSDNMKDMYSKGRHGGNSQPGEWNPAAKLTIDQVSDIRRLHAQGGVTYEELASQFGVSPGSISNVVRLLAWNHGQPAEDL